MRFAWSLLWRGVVFSEDAVNGRFAEVLFHQFAKLRVPERLVGDVLVGREDSGVKVGLYSGNLALDFLVEEALDVVVGWPGAEEA